MSDTHTVRLYDDNAGDLLDPGSYPDRVSMLPSGRTPEPRVNDRIRILWGQDMLSDILDGRYRAVVCGVNDQDNDRGVISQIIDLVRTSQWSQGSVTSYARVFQDALDVHASSDKEPYILKYDLDSVLVLALLRPKGRDAFTVDDLSRGFETITKMLHGRPDRRPVCSVSFMGAKSNKLVTSESDAAEPTFETVLRTMYGSGFRGDVYPAPQMWGHADQGVFSTFPFPEALDRMRQGSS